jgi:hypothetical protein
MYWYGTDLGYQHQKETPKAIIERVAIAFDSDREYKTSNHLSKSPLFIAQENFYWPEFEALHEGVSLAILAWRHSSYRRASPRIRFIITPNPRIVFARPWK